MNLQPNLRQHLEGRGNRDPSDSESRSSARYRMRNISDTPCCQPSIPSARKCPGSTFPYLVAPSFPVFIFHLLAWLAEPHGTKQTLHVHLSSDVHLHHITFAYLLSSCLF